MEGEAAEDPTVASAADPVVSETQNQDEIVNSNEPVQPEEIGDTVQLENEVVDKNVEEGSEAQETQNADSSDGINESENPEHNIASTEEDTPLVVPKKRERKQPDTPLTSNNYYGNLHLKNLQILLDKLFIPLIGFEESKPKTETAKHISMDFTTSLYFHFL